MSFVIREKALPVFKSDGLPPKTYYRLDEAAEILGTTSDALIHYAATVRLELVTPVPQGCWATATNTITEETDAPFLSPDFLVLSKDSCREIELFGHTAITSFLSGYEIWGCIPMPCLPYDPPLDEDGEEIKPNAAREWKYLLDGAAEVKVARIDSSLLFVICDELERFKTGGVKHTAEIDVGKHSREQISNSNKPDKLAALNQAFWKFWANADQKERSTHPDNIDVAAWLESRGYSSSMAKKAASIIRPEWAPVGRKPEE